jgi:hypothetical protein
MNRPGGSFGHADGLFTGPNTFFLTWTGDTFIGTVHGNKIEWDNKVTWMLSKAPIR